jgi:hypothetical protein
MNSLYRYSSGLLCRIPLESTISVLFEIRYTVSFEVTHFHVERGV